MSEHDYPRRVAEFLEQQGQSLEITGVVAELVEPGEFEDDPGGLTEALRVVLTVKVPAGRVGRPLPLLDFHRLAQMGALEAEFGVPIFVQCEIVGPQPRYHVGRAD